MQPSGVLEADRQLILAALRRDQNAVRVLVDRLTPTIQSRVARLLLRTPMRTAALREAVEDLTQDVFVALFANHGHTLSSWSPERGVPLEGFVSVVAERLAISALRSRRKSPVNRHEDPSAFDELAAEENPIEATVTARDALAQIAMALRNRLSERGLEMFRRLFVLQESVQDICERTGESADAIYQWRSRLKKMVAELAEEGGSGLAQEIRSR